MWLRYRRRQSQLPGFVMESTGSTTAWFRSYQMDSQPMHESFIQQPQLKEAVRMASRGPRSLSPVVERRTLECNGLASLEPTSRCTASLDRLTILEWSRLRGPFLGQLPEFLSESWPTTPSHQTTAGLASGRGSGRCWRPQLFKHQPSSYRIGRTT